MIINAWRSAGADLIARVRAAFRRLSSEVRTAPSLARTIDNWVTEGGVPDARVTPQSAARPPLILTVDQLRL